MTTCRKCGYEGEMAKGQGRLCHSCTLAYQREYQAKNADRIKAQRSVYWAKRMENPEFVAKNRVKGRAYWDDLRHEVIMAYGGYKCACCGETEPKFLSIDHVNNDGSSHRKTLGDFDGNGKGAGGATWKWLKRNNYPAGFQILCMNCNFGKARNNGICPHHNHTR